MKRRTIASAAKWGLTGAAVVMAVVWVRSYWRPALWESADLHMLAAIARGRVLGWHSEQEIRVIDVSFQGELIVGTPQNADIEIWPGPAFPHGEIRRDGFHATIPLWLPLALTSLPAGLLWRAGWRRRAWVKRGGCVGCGYDRSGLGAEVVCPECGSAPAKPAG